jgi:hypothetical protein
VVVPLQSAHEECRGAEASGYRESHSIPERSKELFYNSSAMKNLKSTRGVLETAKADHLRPEILDKLNEL